MSPAPSGLLHRVRSHQRTSSTTSPRALDALLRAVRDLSRAEDAGQVQRIAAKAARRVVGADGATFVLRDGGLCFYVDEDAIAPLWKGQRFPLESCISGWSMLEGRSAAIDDIYADARIPHDAYRPTFVRSLLMTPIRPGDPLGAIGMYWATRHSPTRAETGLARALADSTAVALQHVATLGELHRERRLSATDPLTGLLNRRGWEDALAARTAAAAQDSVAIVDLDDFKSYNDSHGHAAGDERLRTITARWLEAVRPGDVIARIGGDEFGVLLADCGGDEAAAVAERLREAVADLGGASVGLATRGLGEDVPALLARADRALYDAKRRGRNRVVAAT